MNPKKPLSRLAILLDLRYRLTMKMKGGRAFGSDPSKTLRRDFQIVGPVETQMEQLEAAIANEKAKKEGME